MTREGSLAASAMEQQAVKSEEMADNAIEARRSTEDLYLTGEHMVAAGKQISEAAHRLRQRAYELSELAGEMKDSISVFHL